MDRATEAQRRCQLQLVQAMGEASLTVTLTAVLEGEGPGQLQAATPGPQEQPEYTYRSCEAAGPAGSPRAGAHVALARRTP